MIIETILKAIFSLLTGVFNFLPDIAFNSELFNISDFLVLISGAFKIFPVDVFLVCISNISFWLSVHMLWAIIEWCYKKIPGIS